MTQHEGKDDVTVTSSEEITTENVSIAEVVEESQKLKSLLAAWPQVESYLNDLGFVAKIFPRGADPIVIMTNPDLTVTAIAMDYTLTAEAMYKNADSKCWDKAQLLLQLLTKTNVDPYLAIEIASGLRRHVIAELGPMRSAAGLTDEEFQKRLERLIDAAEEIHFLSNCKIFVTKCTFAAVGDSKFLLEFVLNLADICIRLGYHPLCVMRTMVVGIEEDADLETPVKGYNRSFVPFYSKLMNGKLEHPDKFDPWELYNDHVRNGGRAFCLPAGERTVERLEKYKQKFDLCLSGLYLNWSLDLDKKIVTVSTTSMDERLIDKALDVLQLLARSCLPPSLMIRVINCRVPHLYMDTGPCRFGLCSSFRIRKEEYLERWDRLCDSTQAIRELTSCEIYSFGPYLSAWGGTSGGLEMVRMIVECFIVHNVDPANFIAKIKHKGSNEMIKRLSERKKETVRRRHGESSMLDESFTEYYIKSNEKRLLYAWPMVEAALNCYGISCKLNQVDRSMTVSTTERTKDRKSIVKAGHLLELLGTTDLPPSLAIDIMKNLRQHLLVKIGNQEGGLCSVFGIEEDEYVERRARFLCSLKEIRALTKTSIYVKGDTVTVVGDVDPPNDRIEKVRTLVEGYIVHGVEHECVGGRRKSGGKRKREDVNVWLGRSLKRLCV